MKPLLFLLAALVAAVSLASFAGSAKAETKCDKACQSALLQMQHEAKKAIIQNLRA